MSYTSKEASFAVTKGMLFTNLAAEVAVQLALANASACCLRINSAHSLALNCTDPSWSVNYLEIKSN